MSVDKDAIDTYNGILFRHEKKKENLAICDNMDGFWAYAKWAESKKDNVSSTYNLKKKRKNLKKQSGMVISKGRWWGMGEMLKERTHA